MRIGLIGCGRAGVTIFRLLRRNNMITGVYDTRKKSEKTAARLLKIRENPDLENLVGQSRAIFIATPDDQILNAYAKIRKYLDGRKYLFHLSGILPADIIPRTKNIKRASVHPFAAFPKIAAPPSNRHFLVSVEGDTQAVQIARNIFPKSNFTLRKINKKDKAVYHLVGVFSSNLLVGLFASIARLAEMIDWHQEEFDQLIFPIIKETVNNLMKYGIRNALTGPLARGDRGIIRKHLRALKNDKTLLSVYKALSLSIVDAMSDGKRRRALRKMFR